jgi:uncharacterized protein (DUF4415 family)
MLETVKTRRGRVLVLPTPEEDAVLTAAAMDDPDATPLSDAEWEAVQPALRRGRPRLAAKKEALNVRYSPEVLAAFRATGKGWQTRMNAALADWLKTHSPLDAG